MLWLGCADADADPVIVGGSGGPVETTEDFLELVDAMEAVAKGAAQGNTKATESIARRGRC